MESPDPDPLIPPRGKIDRMTAQVRGLAADLRTWIDLKIQLIEIQVEEKARRLARRAAVSVVIAGIALLGVVFGLISGALALGAWWGSAALGFLAVSVLLVLIALLVFGMRHRIVGDPEPEVRSLPAAERLPELPAGDGQPAKSTSEISP